MAPVVFRLLSVTFPQFWWALGSKCGSRRESGCLFPKKVGAI